MLKLVIFSLEVLKLVIFPSLFFPDECVRSEVEDENIFHSIIFFVVCISTYVVDVYETFFIWLLLIGSAQTCVFLQVQSIPVSIVHVGRGL